MCVSLGAQVRIDAVREATTRLLGTAGSKARSSIPQDCRLDTAKVWNAHLCTSISLRWKLGMRRALCILPEGAGKYDMRVHCVDASGQWMDARCSEGTLPKPVLTAGQRRMLNK
eukprot:jgi/Picre1/27290/NNA_000259.t1